ncbi:MAG: PilZ domain-containing protein [Bdellovibrionaceae bacterium]|nr:PilZ domain-containing protein [Pseudobdellovibrionaceae bacterium]
MTKKPIVFNLIPLILIAIAFSFYFQIAYLLDLKLTSTYRILTHITLPNWVTMLLLTASAFTIYHGSRYAKVFMPLTVLAVVWNNYLVAAYANNFSLVQTLTPALFFPFLFLPFYSQVNQTLLSDRRQHWWETARRKAITAPVVVNPFVSNSFNSRSYDVSKSGLFLQLDQATWESLPKVGERVNLSITLDTLRKVRCEAVIVRLEEAKGNYPRGMGLHFTELSSDSRRTLNSFLDQ